ncbi:K(+)-transporting ATPase subunit C [Leifsonia sp. 21MFCrub1.1]|uniref:K(+)-transporting ATPase subunit C n=1 Tax=Leifsonia sp. 21MFCrub1.1 TaxID=1798223 RepID=UPI0008929DA5|nr:K(+)-transporting ATPase subunit C [Leifsonia sp. 21MFCrub1.1]SEA51839.1 K+-transporting ATPase ATPase C chain [Leifsonia sp. 21MFCrub1.1]
MNASARGTGRQYWVGLRALLILTVVLGIAYPLVVTGIGQLAFPNQSNGSAVTSQGKVVGSALIGQSFTDKKGKSLPQWFQSRPSAAGDGYDGGASSGSNLGPNNPDLLKAVEERKQAIEKTDGVDAGRIPADALTASGSGLDPHISPAYAYLQVDAVARARGISADTVRSLVDAHVQQRDLGYLGEPTVNVLQLNIALAAMDPAGNK